MKVSIIECTFCGKLVERPTKEVKRSKRLGRRLFCSLSCTAKTTNYHRRVLPIQKECVYCKSLFSSTTSKKAKKYCSPSCASLGSITEKRKKSQQLQGHLHSENLLKTHQALKLREEWKYKALEKELRITDRDFEFEFEIHPYIYDLALHDIRLLVEFDGKYHRTLSQRKLDKKKDEHANRAGWDVIRKRVVSNTQISPELLVDL